MSVDGFIHLTQQQIGVALFIVGSVSVLLAEPLARLDGYVLGNLMSLDGGWEKLSRRFVTWSGFGCLGLAVVLLTVR